MSEASLTSYQPDRASARHQISNRHGAWIWRLRAFAVTLAVGLGVVQHATAQPDDTPPSPYLDVPYVNEVAGISIQPPRGGESVAGKSSDDEVVRFRNEADDWDFVVSQIRLAEPTPLTERDAPDDQVFARGGIVAIAAGQMPNDTPGKLLKAELVPLAGQPAAILATRYRQNGVMRLRQQALVQRTETLYYVVTFTAAVGDVEDIEQDEGARLASEVFQSSLDTLRLLDQGEIVRDQHERLFRMRALIANWNENRLRSVVIPTRYFRLQKAGRDVGYAMAVEEFADDLPRAGKVPPAKDPGKSAGLRVGTRTRTFAPDGSAIDLESWMWTRFDRQTEAFSNLLVVTDPTGEKNFAMERGTSTVEDRVVPRRIPNESGIGERIEGVRQRSYDLEVWSIAKQQALPSIRRELPAYYQPLAIVYLLPRLVPLSEPTSYMYAAYVPDRREVMLRYVDIDVVQEVTIDGRRQLAVPVRERIGLQGAESVHYMTPDGRFLGTHQKAIDTWVLPTDEATINRIYQNADLRKPQDVND